ncbi:hypothetical protein RGQ29_031139, partial [Quercus rubra]
SRPGQTQVPLCETIPVLETYTLPPERELSFDRAHLIKQIIQASQEFGFFQLINHGVSEKLTHNVIDVGKEFFVLPAKDKASLYSEDPKQKDTLRHPCHPLEEHNAILARKATSLSVRKLSLWVLDLICEGLGLESRYLREELSQVQLMAINHYPPCPDPSLTLGLPKHSDVNLITFLLQRESHGLQVLKDGQWLAIEPLPNAFVVNVCHMLHIIRNGKLSSADHRVVTNKKIARTTVTSFIHPSNNCRIEPAKVLLSDYSPPLYRDFVYKDFLRTYMANTHNRVPPLEAYKIQN